jgi:hypothetical protein
MADQEKDKQLDEMLDSLLANYSSAEPRPGIETRILANLREAAEKEVSHGWWNFKWLWAGVVAAAIIMAAVLNSGRRHVAPPTNVAGKISQPVPQSEIQPHAPVARGETARIYRHKKPGPTLAQSTTLALSQRPALFPTPTPLSEQERLMFTYLAKTPKEVVVAQMQRDDQKEAEAFWEDREPSSGTRRSTTTR